MKIKINKVFNKEGTIKIKNNSNSNKSITPFYMDYGQNWIHNIQTVSKNRIEYIVITMLSQEKPSD